VSMVAQPKLWAARVQWRLVTYGLALLFRGETINPEGRSDRIFSHANEIVHLMPESKLAKLCWKNKKEEPERAV